MRAAWVLFLALAQDGKVEPTKDSLEVIKAAVEKKEAVLLDVREESEWKEGHLKLATFLALSWLRKESEKESFAEAVAAKVPKGKIIYTHCRAGVRSMTAAGLLKKLGYDVRPLRQSYETLKKGGFEEVTDP